MENSKNYTFTEITTQVAAWADALQAFAALETSLKQAWESLNPKQVLFIGCGSTHYLSQTAAALFQELTGVPAWARPSSEVILFPDQVLADPSQTLLVTISRSGTTTETLVAIDKFKQLGGRAVWGITCDPDSPQAKACDLVLPAEAAQEKSVAQTRSFAAMLVLAQMMAATLGGHETSMAQELPKIGEQLIDETSLLMVELGERTDIERLYFLGSGFQYGIANEAMLKMKEMSLSHSEGYHFMEFRHGPMSMVTEQALVVGLLSKQAFEHEQKVLAEMKNLGGNILTLSPLSDDENTAQQISLPNDLPAWMMPVLYLLPLQLLAYYRTISKGLNPDNPRHLSQVIYLDAADLAGS
jgi:glucosamine--fructose-6-phosphate aminotransferase (isomerizing)